MRRPPAPALLIVLANLLFGSAGAQVTAPSTGLAIHNVSVVPMDSERVLGGQTVIIRNGIIESIGDAATTRIPDGMTRIDGTNRYLMPGLADLHVHLRNRDELVNYLYWGVTTVMHLGGSGQSAARQLEFRQQIRDGAMPGPNLYTTDRVFDGDPALPRNARSLTNPDAARAAVREVRAGGFDFVKIYNNVSQPVFEAIVDEAQRQGLAVIGHIPRSFDPLLSLGGGQNAIAHTEELFFTYFEGPRDETAMSRDYAPDLGKLPKLIEVLQDNGVALMPDLCFTFTNMLMWDGLEHLWNDPEFPYLQPATAALWRRGTINRRSAIENFIVRGQWKYSLMQTLTLEFEKAGLLQVIGTDASLPGLFPGKAVHRELTELVKAGIGNFDALSMGTRNAGEFVRRFIDTDARFGQVLPGYRADLVLLAANPLDDVRRARDVHGVVVSGRFTSRAELEGRRAALRARYAAQTTVGDEVAAAVAVAGAQARIETVMAAHADDEEMLAWIESRINTAGYSAAFADELERARSILALNARLFPQSANTWDSLAEITRYMGDADEALALYRKVLEVDPAFSSAADAIEQLLRETGNGQ